MSCCFLRRRVEHKLPQINQHPTRIFICQGCFSVWTMFGSRGGGIEWDKMSHERVDKLLRDLIVIEAEEPERRERILARRMLRGEVEVRDPFYREHILRALSVIEGGTKPWPAAS